MIRNCIAALGLVVAFVHLGAAPLAQSALPPSVPVAEAKPGEVRVIATAAIRLPADVVAQAEKAIGKKLVIQYGSARGNLKETILKGQDFEVAILLPDVNEELHRAGKILAETHDIASVPVGFAQRGDVPAVDVSTPAAIKTAFLNATSVKYSPTGAAILTVRKVLSQLELAGRIKDSSALRTEVPLGPGEYEINIYPISEIIPNTRLKNLGIVIAPLQVPSILQTVIGTAANDQQTARALIRFFQGPALDAMLKSNGMVKSVANGRLQ
jgi:molybdate transport system substrate-binding protein